ncbi:MAG: glycosyltransferase family 2 protein [Flavobacteriales bacterium]|nr:glycosyltransferase family 2 protein [Flavobacteriales bacterium]MEB2340875.1 glycosyltransferase family 2 protein [Flavobacteriia bacterium]
MKLSVVIPAHNEVGSIEATLRSLHATLQRESLAFEVVVVDDHSKDGTGELLGRLRAELPELVVVENEGPSGYGHAVRRGLEHFTGDRVAIMMADLSDDPEDLVRFNRKMDEGYDCVFGTRWSKGGKVIDYPWTKRVVNRMANNLVRLVFRLRYDDCTNAFKLFSRETILGLHPFLSPHFNLTLELPLKAIVRGYSFAVVPNSWQNRKAGESKLKIKEMGSRYFFILLYCLIEKYFSRGDFRKSPDR